MIARSVLILFTLCLCIAAEPVLRISKVVDKKNEEAETLTHRFKTQDGEERERIVWVKKEIKVKQVVSAIDDDELASFSMG